MSSHQAVEGGGGGAPPASPVDAAAQAEKIRQIQDFTQCPQEQARGLLILSAWDTERAVARFLEDPASGIGVTDSTPLVDPQTNEAIMDQRNAIMKQIEETQPLLTERVEVAKLSNEFVPGSGFARKIPTLARAYPTMRKCRGDGNCFYRSFSFAYLERLVQQPDPAEIQRITNVFAGLKKALDEKPYEPSVYEDFYGVWTQTLQDIAKGSLTREAFEQSFFNGDGWPLFGIYFPRMVVTCEMLSRQEFFTPFCFEEASVEVYCRNRVEATAEEADQVHIIALSDALGVPIKVVYVDDSDSDKPTEHFFDASAHRGADGPRRTHDNNIVTLLYRPGHYDILYPAPE